MEPSLMKHYNFGVEIEAVVTTYANIETANRVEWLRLLATSLENRNIPAVHDDNSAYSKHPEYYNGKWFITRDGSLARDPDCLAMEIVSPKLTTRKKLEPMVADVWEAISVHFTVKKNDSCGGHVHVTPLRRTNRFTLAEHKAIAFATVFYEDYVTNILPEPRRANRYCVPNTTSVSRSGVGCGLQQAIQGNKTTNNVWGVAWQVRGLESRKQLCGFMQANRYVLWNFANIFREGEGKCTGTVEFRGGSQFRKPEGALSWVAFVLGFITLAIEENLVDRAPTYYPPTAHTMTDWWERIRASAERSNLGCHLPENYMLMK